ncbi:MAG: LysE family transporter [Thermodesulfobacteriota bacterium]
MINESASLFSTFGLIFSFSFLVALTGAMAPGPLLTYTIIQSIKTSRRGYLTGIWVIIGHAALEMGIIIFLLLGFSFIFKKIMVVRAIGTVGGIILAWFGVGIIRNVYTGNLSTCWLQGPEQAGSEPAGIKRKGLDNPVLGGVLVSMSNPYWWVWWATIGFAFMIRFDVSFQKWPRLIAFFAGHEAGDLLWYLIVSVLAFFGVRNLNRKIYCGILVCCGIFMILFGLYLGSSTFLRSTR